MMGLGVLPPAKEGQLLKITFRFRIITLISTLLNCNDLQINPTSYGIRGCSRPTILVNKTL
jgi:hypothetical protein